MIGQFLRLNAIAKLKNNICRHLIAPLCSSKSNLGSGHFLLWCYKLCDDQCDQIDRLFTWHVTIYNSENLPSFIKNTKTCSMFCTKLSNSLKNSRIFLTICQSGNISPNLVPLTYMLFGALVTTITVRVCS